MSKADDEAFARLDLNEELKAAMAAERSKKPVRAIKRKGEPVATMPGAAEAAVGGIPVVVHGTPPGLMPQPPAVAPVVQAIAPAQAQQAPMQAPQVQMPSLQAHAMPQVQAPQVQVPQVPVQAPVVQEPEPEPEPQTARQVSVYYTRLGRRPEGFILPREDHRRRTQLSCAPKVLRQDDKQRFDLVVPANLEGPQELRSIQFPSFGAGRLLVEAILLDDVPIMSAPGSIAAEFFTPAARENATPFAVLTAESKLTIVVHNVSPTPVPVHPSATIAALEQLRNAQG